MPQFVLEVASESTWRDDVEEKRDLYALAGVQEYLVFDPTGGFIRERVRAWRAGEDGWQIWPAARAHRQRVWHSQVLGLHLRVEGSLLRFDHPVSGPLLVRREVVTRWHAAQRALKARERALEATQRALEAAQRALEAIEQDRDQERAARGAAERRAQAAEDALAALREELRRRDSGQ